MLLICVFGGIFNAFAPFPLFSKSQKLSALYCVQQICGRQSVHYKPLRFFKIPLRDCTSATVVLSARLESMIPPGLILIPHSREKTRVVLCTTILQLVVEVVEKLKWKV